MWKEEKPVQPFNATIHVNIDNLSFVTGLRQTASLDTQLQKYKEQKQTDQQQSLEKKFVKPTNCIFQSCTNIGVEITNTLNERVDIIEKIRSTAINLVDQDEYCQIVELECDKVTKSLMIVEAKAEALSIVETVDLKRKLQHATAQRKQLEAQIRMANKQLKALKDLKARQQGHVVSSPVPERDPDKVYFEHLDIGDHKKHVEKKHNGIYGITDEGFKAWSCCFCPDEHSAGCIDDRSVNLRQSLGNMRRTTHNYIEYPMHPLVTTSSIVLNGSNSMLLQAKAREHKSLRPMSSDGKHHHNSHHSSSHHSSHRHHGHHHSHHSSHHSSVSANNSGHLRPHSAHYSSHHGAHHSSHQPSSPFGSHISFGLPMPGQPHHPHHQSTSSVHFSRNHDHSVHHESRNEHSSQHDASQHQTHHHNSLHGLERRSSLHRSASPSPSTVLNVPDSFLQSSPVHNNELLNLTRPQTAHVKHTVAVAPLWKLPCPVTHAAGKEFSKSSQFCPGSSSVAPLNPATGAVSFVNKPVHKGNIGKMRVDLTRVSGKIVNRPMSSPAGFALYQHSS